MFFILLYSLMLGYMASGRTENELVILGFVVAGMLVGICLNIYIELGHIREKLVGGEEKSSSNIGGPKTT
jgi:uncharacterized membrane protein YqgA involved in biofilm formation